MHDVIRAMSCSWRASPCKRGGGPELEESPGGVAVLYTMISAGSSKEIRARAREAGRATRGDGACGLGRQQTAASSQQQQQWQQRQQRQQMQQQQPPPQRQRPVVPVSPRCPLPHQSVAHSPQRHHDSWTTMSLFQHRELVPITSHRLRYSLRLGGVTRHPKGTRPTRRPQQRHQPQTQRRHM